MCLFLAGKLFFLPKYNLDVSVNLLRGESYLKKTPLNGIHHALGGKMVEYAGFEMPLQYAGVLSEHINVRTNVGLFDLTHMGEFELKGPSALDTLNQLTTNDASNLVYGEIQYTCLVNENGGILDDILVYRLQDSFLLVVNAANTAKDFAWIKKRRLKDTELIDRSSELSLIAVQGPKSASLVEDVLETSLINLNNYKFVETSYKGEHILLSRTGYTGEDGFELYFANDLATKLWEDFMDQGTKYDVQPIGLAARDTLRLEMRMPLYGNDVDEEISPLEAGLTRFVKFDKEDFVGKDALIQQKKQGVERKLVGFTMLGKGIPRQGYSLLNEVGETIGVVTSGTHSPSLDQPIGMGYVTSDYAKVGTKIRVQIRTRMVEAEIIKGRFLAK